MFSSFQLRFVSYFECVHSKSKFSALYGQDCMKMDCAIFHSPPRLSRKSLHSQINPHAPVPCLFNISNDQEITQRILYFSEVSLVPASDPAPLQG